MSKEELKNLVLENIRMIEDIPSSKAFEFVLEKRLISEMLKAYTSVLRFCDEDEYFSKNVQYIQYIEETAHKYGIKVIRMEDYFIINRKSKITNFYKSHE